MTAPAGHAAFQRGVACMEAARFEDAAAAFRAALQDLPLAAEPRVGLAQAHHAMGDHWQATAWMSDACRVAPQRVELWQELARLLVQLQREPELEPLLAVAQACNPDNAALLQMRADLLLRGKRYAEALPLYERLHALQPGDAASLLHHGFCEEQAGSVEGAVRLYRAALALREDFLEAHVDLAGVLWRVEDFEAALAHARRAVELAPRHPYAVRILGTALLNLNRVAEAEATLRRALELQPGFPLAEVDLAFALLLDGRLREGWRMYALRWHDTERMRRPSFWRAALEWRGPEVHPLRGLRIAVYAEQGLGDVLQFIRYVPLLQAQGASVVGVVQPELVPLLEHGIEGLECLKPDRELRADCHAALLDLPMHLGTDTVDRIPSPQGYLRAPAAKVREWRDRMPPRDGRLRVGVAWSGSHRQVNNANRAMRLSDLRPVLETDGVQCFSLQKADAGPLTDIATDGLVDLTPRWCDFTDSAAMLEHLDLVVTVDTSIAHLAGAMGRPVWVLLAPNADWRWLLEREDSPWYASMRLFRRGFGEPRAAQVARVAAALRDRVLRAGRP